MSHSSKWRWPAGAAVAICGAAVAVVIASGAGAARSATTTTTSTTTTTATPPPKNTQPPTLNGTPVEGNTLTATNGTWTGANLKFTYRFLRCDGNGGNCYAGGSTTQKTYKLTAQDVGNTIRVRVTATNSAGSASATSAPTAVIRKAAAPPPSNGCPSGTGTIAIAQLAPPARLTVDRQDASPGVIGHSTQQLQLRFHVSACSGRDVQGALVYTAAVPFQQFTIPPETATGPDGWASLTMTQLRGFPAANHQQLLVVFVRARKSGEDLLGGVSTRRLVSFPVDLRH